MKYQEFFKTTLRFFGAVKLAIFLILTLAVVLSFATFFEAKYGTSAAQYSIYKTVWFGLLLFLMGINVL